MAGKYQQNGSDGINEVAKNIVNIKFSTQDDIVITGACESVKDDTKFPRDTKEYPGNPTAFQQVSVGKSAFKLTRYLPPTEKCEHLSDSLQENSDLHSKITYIYAPSDPTEKERIKKIWRNDMETENSAGIDNKGFSNDEVVKAERVEPRHDTVAMETNTTVDDVVINVEIPYNEFQAPDGSLANSGSLKGPPTAQVSPRMKDNDANDTNEIRVSKVGDEKRTQQVGSELERDTDTTEEENTKSRDNGGIDNAGKMERNNNASPSEVNNSNVDEETKWLSWMEAQFKKIAGEDNQISLEEFKDALKVKRNFFAERFFHLFDKDGSGTIDCVELMDGLRMITKGTSEQKLRFLYDVYDLDGSGTIDREELRTVLNACMEESSLSFGEDNLDKLTDTLFDAADEDRSGSISFEELKAELEKHPGVLENLTISAAQWLKPTAKTKKKGFRRYFTLLYIKNNLRKVLFLLWFILMNIGLGIYAAWNYRNSNGFVIVARICGMNLNFNGMFILVLMLRKCITYLRETFVAIFLPLDQSILFHKMVGVTITFYSIVHTLAHIGNAVLWTLEKGDLEIWEILFTTQGGIGWVANTAYITGWPLLIIIIVMFICSLPFVRRSGHFQVFYWTHMLYVPFWVLLILHGPSFWKWFVAPGVLFLLEKIFRSKLIKWARYGKTYIEEVRLLPSGVCHLSVSRPENFKYQPGDYIFIQIPVIAAQEWHPFTISSAPEMEGHIWLHVRSAGHWTNKLYEYFSRLDPHRVGKTIRLVPKNYKSNPDSTSKNVKMSRVKAKGRRRNFNSDEMTVLQSERRKSLKHKHVRIKCFIDGPYGTATREIFETEHAVLIGAGIGVTPMASILQSIMYRYKESKQTCPHCKQSFYGKVPETTMKLKKVDFIWINRDQKCFEWFVSLLNQLELEQLEVQTEDDSENSKVIEMHMYMTAAHGKTDMKGIGLQMALDLMHKKEDKDLITGLKTRTQPGRPNWNKVFGRIANEKKGKIKVFFCGAPILGKTIKEKCMQFKFAFSKENF